MKTRTVRALAGVLLIIVVGVALLYAVRAQGPATVVLSGPSASPAASSGNSPSLSASPTLAPGTFENRILGYRITLPVAYRLARTFINAGQPEQLGGESFNVSTLADARADCLSDTGGGLASLIKGDRKSVV